MAVDNFTFMLPFFTLKKNPLHYTVLNWSVLADNGFWFAYKCRLYKHSHDPLYRAVAAVAVHSSRLIRDPKTAVSFSPCPTTSKPISRGSSHAHG